MGRSAWGRHLERWSGALKRELLREPARVLLDRGPDFAQPPRDDRSGDQALLGNR